jgi:ABC-type molybdate transport system substrate-binding protein
VHSLARWLAALGVAALWGGRPASAADLRVMISAGFHGVYSELAPAFERASGHHLITTRGPSMGDSPESIPARLARGEAELGFQQVAELIHVPGITFVGALPAEVQPVFSFAGALTQTVQQPEAATALLRFLGSSAAVPVIVKGGLMPIAGR